MIMIKEKNMRDLAAFRKELIKHPRLTYLFVELTDCCNLSCIHCGSGCMPFNSHYLEADMLIETLRTIKEDFPCNSVMICLTGGEPMIHPEFNNIIKKIHSLRLPWGITTNGTLITQSRAEELKRNSIGSITISIDGTEETHDYFRGLKGSFERAKAGIMALKNVGIPVQITTVVHKKNIKELDEMYSLMRLWKVDSWRIINIEPIGRARTHKELLLSVDEVKEMLDFIREKRFDCSADMDICYGCSHYLSFEYEHEVRDNYFICGAGVYVGSILCNGDIYSCLDIERRPELVQGNISKDRFSDVWNNKFQAFRKDRTEDCEMCKFCTEREFCGGDSMHTWDFDAKKPLFCYLSREVK